MSIHCTKPVIYSGEGDDMADLPMVELTIRMPLARARRLAAHKRTRGRLDILADEAKEVGEPVLEALCDAGVDR